MNKKRIKKKCFTFLEIMVGLSVLMISSGVIGWKMDAVLKAREFQLNLRQLRSSFRSVHILSMNMQKDWQILLKQQGKYLVFQAICVEGSDPVVFFKQQIDQTDLFFDEKPLNIVYLNCFASGKIHPLGTLGFQSRKNFKVEKWNLSSLFGLEEGDGMEKMGPLHPDIS